MYTKASLPPQGPVDGDVFDSIAAALEKNGYIVIANALPPEHIDSLFLHLKSIDQQGFKAAGIGREQNFQLNRFVRTDEIAWVENEDPGLSGYLHWMETLRLQLNRQLFLGLFDFECHFAHYSTGAYYKRHVDAFKGNSARKVSTILYLNPNWNTSDGGELVVYSPDGEQVLEKISPEYGKLVLFLSEVFPHEVLPAKTDRYSLTGWYRINNSIGNAIDPPVTVI